MTKTISKSLRYTILERDGFACRSCGANNCLEIDHIIPRSKGGLTIESNLQVLCADCNRGKGAKLPSGIASIGLTLPELEHRWALTRNALKARAAMLDVELIRVSSTCTVWPHDKIPIGDALNAHLKSGKPSKSFTQKNSLSQINLRIEEEILMRFKFLAKERGFSNNKAAQIALELFLSAYENEK